MSWAAAVWLVVLLHVCAGQDEASGSVGRQNNCGREYKALHDPAWNRTVGSPGTFRSTDCSTSIWTFEGNRIYLEFTEFDLDCANEYLEIRSGYDLSGTLLGRFCGSELRNFTSPGDNLLLTFHSDSGVPEAGYLAHYSVFSGEPLQPWTCSEYYAGYYAANITSPSYPNSYPNSTNICSVIYAEAGQQIQLEFSEFQIEYGWECQYDYLEIRDGDNSSAPLLARFCGHEGHTHDIVSSGSALYIKFHSNRGGSIATPIVLDGSGYLAYYSTHIPGDTTDDSGDTTDDCTGLKVYFVTEGERRTISSPLYPSNYPNSADCTTLIETYSNDRINLEFAQFNLEEGHGLTCAYDYLEIYDGYNATATSLGRKCGTYATNITSSGNALYIKFVSDSSITKPGYLAYYSVDAYAASTDSTEIQVQTPDYHNYTSSVVATTHSTLLLTAIAAYYVIMHLGQ